MSDRKNDWPIRHDTALFFTIVFGLATVATYLLQANGVITVSWIPSIGGYAIMLGIFSWSFLKWDIPHRWRAVTRWTVLSACGLGIFVLGFLGVSTQYAREYPKAKAQTSNSVPPLTKADLEEALKTQRPNGQDSGHKTLGQQTPLPEQEGLTYPGFKENIETVSLSIGGMRASYPLSELRKKKHGAAFNIGDDTITPYLIGNKVYTDVSLYAGPSSPPVEVKRGTFVVRRPGWDRNADRGAFEVVNEAGVPVFQMIYLTPGDIVIKGIIVLKKAVFIADDTGTLVNPGPQFPYKISRIFRYPSSIHAGERQ
jgi:hypothetical protein